MPELAAPRRLAWRRGAALALVLFVLLALGIVAHRRHLRIAQAERLEAQIRAVVSVGMTEAEARTALQDAGFRVGEAVKPTAAEYYAMYVRIQDSISPLNTLGYVVTGGDTVLSEQTWVVIELGPDRRVTSID